MRSFVLLAALVSVAGPALAQTADVHRGQILRDAKNARVGVIDSVSTDGQVGIVIDAKYYRLPISTVSLVEGKPQTTLTKREILGR